MKKKALIALAMVACMLLGVAGTYAYLTAQSNTVTNTFTSGNVAITLDEANIATEDANDRTTTGNQYKIYPGGTYDKDPTITVVAGSEECYVGAVVTISDWTNWKAIYGQNAKFETLLAEGGGLGGNWEIVKEAAGDGNNTYVVSLVYNAKVTAGTTTNAIFTKIQVPTTATAELLGNISGDTMNVVGYAIQTNGMGDDAEVALAKQWTAFVK